MNTLEPPTAENIDGLSDLLRMLPEGELRSFFGAMLEILLTGEVAAVISVCRSSDGG